MEIGNNTAAHYFVSRKVSLTLLAAAAIVCSRALFFFFNDPEGPNLLIVLVLASALYGLSFAVYAWSPAGIRGFKRLLMVIGIQVLAVIGLYFCM